MSKVLVLNGINLNMFGKRDPTHYGTTNLAEIDAQVSALGRKLGYEVECFQNFSNSPRTRTIDPGALQQFSKILFRSNQSCFPF